MKRINKGKIENGEYVKHVSFSKAVLWKDRQLSLRPEIISQLKIMNIEKLHFIDDKKKEKWTFKLKEILENGSLRTVGQEEQFYFPIYLARKNTVDNNK